MNNFQKLALASVGAALSLISTETIPANSAQAAILNNGTIPGFPSYRTVEQTYSDLSQLAADNPNIASWFSIGESYDKITPGGSAGYDIYALELTNKNIIVPGGKPTLYIQAALHAREYTTAEAVTRFGEYLVANYNKDPDITWLLDYFKTAIVPIANPDGRKMAEQGLDWRKNTNPKPHPGAKAAPFPLYGVDLNRNYDFKWGQIQAASSSNPNQKTYRGAKPFSEPETQALSRFVTSLFPDQRGPNDTDAAPNDATGVYLDIHSHGNSILYPWGTTPKPAPNAKQLQTLARKGGYYTAINGTPYDVYQANGLYPTDGTSRDWAYGTLGVATYTWEMGTAFFEDSDYFEKSIFPQVIPAWIYNFKAARNPYQAPSGPESLELSFDPTTMLLSAIANDTRYADSILEAPNQLEAVQNIAAARYTIDTPPWITGTPIYSLTVTDGAFDNPVESLLAKIDPTGLLPGRHTLFVESQDTDGNWGVPSALFFELSQIQPPKSVPEPSNELSLLALGALGAGSALIRIAFRKSTTHT